MKPDVVNKLVLAVIGILLSIIGFFCIQTYNKILDLNISMKRIEIELAKIQTQAENYVTKVEMIQYIEEHYKK